MTRRLTISGAAVAAVLLSAAAAPAQVHPHPAEGKVRTTAPSIQIPAAMKAEHAELHAALGTATRAPGAVGEAARAVAAVLHPHFQREEEIALPPLGLLAPLARGGVTPQMAEILPLLDALQAELPQMLAEHTRIQAALEALARTARREGRPEYAQLAEKIMSHAAMEEQVNYPAALLVGAHVRRQLGR